MVSPKANGTPTRSRRQRPAKEPDAIEVFSAREHNLRIDHLSVPKHQLVVFTGVSGSGKSSLAFDTLYAEGQRRYVESLSAYARQFLGRLERPDVERLRGLSPTIAIEQKSASSNPRSTVGTITEVYDYLRVLFARAGIQHCHECGKVVHGASADEIVGEVMALPEKTKLMVLAPLVTHRKGEFRELFTDLAQKGFVRIRVNGDLYRLDDPPGLDKKKKHDIELVVDRIAVRASDQQRITESVEQALAAANGEVVLEAPDGGPRFHFSEQRACCGHAFPELSPQSFSFNSPVGMCPRCNGLGTRLEVDPEKVIADPSLSIRGGAIAPWRNSMDRGEGWTFRIVDAMAKTTKVNLDTPWKKLTKKKREQVLYGLSGRRIRVTWGDEKKGNHGSWGVKFEGILNTIHRRYKATSSQQMRDHYMKYMSELPCDECDGKRLRRESLAVRVSNMSIAEVTAQTVAAAHGQFDSLELTGNAAKIAEGVLREVQSRLKFLLDVGLEYLTLDRAGPTLSGGEAQRIRLASQLGSELSGVMYVLDEPSIGLHARDNLRLIQTLQHLRDLGNTVIVVEHDEETIRAADYVVDFGPGAGHLGGEVVFSGTPDRLLKCTKGSTGAFLSGRRQIEAPAERRLSKGTVSIRGARLHNLEGLDVELPLGVLCAVTGVSGAGKSSLVNGILLPAVGRALSEGATTGPGFESVEGLDAIDRIIAINQKPIGRTPRSNPGTYTKVFDEVRKVFAGLPEARARGFNPGRFSFNVKGGRCEACQGDGVVKVEMHFLSDVYVRCEVCAGHRYNAQTLTVKYRGHSIADVLDMSIDDCLTLFESFPKLSRILRTLIDVGLGYIKLGQPATTMSGGEAQRVKLSRELGKRGTGRTLYVLDEPTTGLHFADIEKLLRVLQTLVDAGNTVLVIEHNLDVVKCADWIIDMGPEGGGGGGRVVAEGTPEQVAKVRGSYTGQHLVPLLAKQKPRPRKAAVASKGAPTKRASKKASKAPTKKRASKKASKAPTKKRASKKASKAPTKKRAPRNRAR